MIKISVFRTAITASGTEQLVEGNVNTLSVQFEFLDGWDGLEPVAVFSNNIKKISISASTGLCAIPWEVLSKEGELYVSVRGIGSGGNVVLCTKNLYLGRIHPSLAAAVSAGHQPLTPDVVDNLISRVSELERGGGGAGHDGKSAYEIAVEHGYTGTEEQWLESLKGAPGAPGRDGEDGHDGAPGSPGIPGTTGADGKSAYQIAVENGFRGTEVEWLVSLHGEDGRDGDPGSPGTPGQDGADGHTPVKGVDYFTDADKAEIAQAAAEKIDLSNYAKKSDVDGKLSDAPIDGKQYARQDGSWAEVQGGGTDLPETTALLMGDGNGGALAAEAGVDYFAPNAYGNLLLNDAGVALMMNNRGIGLRGSNPDGTPFLIIEDVNNPDKPVVIGSVAEPRMRDEAVNKGYVDDKFALKSDLTDFYTKTETDNAIAAAIGDAIGGSY